MAKSIIKFITQTLNRATTEGKGLKRWLHATNIILPKTKGTPRADKLRIVHLFEADLNLWWKIIWAKRALRNCNKVMPQEQWGGRGGRQAGDLAAMKETMFATARVNHQHIGMVDLDASACYDRITHASAYVASKWAGVPREARTLLIEVLQHMEYDVRTSNGVSSLKYRHTPENPIHGTGQGSSASPAIWTMLSCGLIHIMNDKQQGVVSKGMVRENDVQSAIAMYVDDASLWAIDNNPMMMEKRLKHHLRCWSYLLRVSGGKLNLQKCFVYAADHTVSRVGVRASDRAVTLRNDGNVIEQKPCTTHHKTIGTYKSIHPRHPASIRIIREKSTATAALAAKANTGPDGTLILYQQYYLPRLRYLLTTADFTEKQLRIAMQPACTLLLRACGFSSKFPRAVLHAPTKAGGANIHSMYSIQTACNLAMITRMLRSDTKLRQMMENLLDRLTIYNGLPGNVLTTDMGSWVPWTWVHPTLQAARSHGICIVAPGRHTLETGTIMQHAGATVRDKETLFRINQVRMSFGVTYIRELYKGDAFDWKYCEPPPHRGDWRSWPKQTQLHTAMLNDWRRWIATQVTTTQYVPGADRCLIQENTNSCLEMLTHTSKMFKLDDDRLGKTLHEGLIYAATDGSVDKTATHAWVLSDGREIIAAGGGITSGCKQNWSSYRSEGFAMIAVHEYLEKACNRYRVDRDRLRIEGYTDSRSIIQTINHQTKSNDNMDMRRELLEWIALHKPSWSHVRAHQDSPHISQALNLDATMNVEADRLANIMQKEPMQERDNPKLPSVLIDGRVVCTKIHQTIIHHIESKRFHAYMKTKLGETIHNSIDWEAYGSAMSMVPPSKRATIIKLSQGWLPTNERLYKTNQQTESVCPNCAETEDNDHFLRCRGERGYEDRQKARDSVIQWAKTTGCPYIVVQELQHLIQEHWADVKNTAPTTHGIWRGWTPKSWKEIIDQRKSMKMKGQTWVSKLIAHMWEVSIDLWRTRNGYIHTNAATNVTKQQTREIYQELRRAAADHPILQVPMSLRLQADDHTLSKWCHDTWPTVWKEQRDRTFGKDIRRYFDRTGTTKDDELT